MARMAGIDLPREKRVEIGLTYIFGIGRKTASQILASTGVNPDTRVKDLTEDDVSKLREYIDHHLHVEGDLRREVSLNIKRLPEFGVLGGSAIEGDCLYADSAQKPMPVQGRVRKRP